MVISYLRLPRQRPGAAAVLTGVIGTLAVVLILLAIILALQNHTTNNLDHENLMLFQAALAILLFLASILIALPLSTYNKTQGFKNWRLAPNGGLADYHIARWFGVIALGVPVISALLFYDLFAGLLGPMVRR